MMKRDLPGTTSLEEEEQRRSEKLPSRPEGCVQVPPRCVTASCCSVLLQDRGCPVALRAACLFPFDVSLCYAAECRFRAA